MFWEILQPIGISFGVYVALLVMVAAVRNHWPSRNANAEPQDRKRRK